ncbi:MAG: YbaB/EbfC family nucleoid-associated protein [Hyphomicrobiales bacterium]
MDFSEIMKQASQLQDKMKSAKENIENIECEGSSGGGLVNVTVNGNGELKKIDIDPSILVASEKEIIEDLIIAAFSDAKSKINDEVAKKMKEITGGLPLPPGFNLGF